MLKLNIVKTFFIKDCTNSFVVTATTNDKQFQTYEPQKTCIKNKNISEWSHNKSSNFEDDLSIKINFLQNVSFSNC